MVLKPKRPTLAKTALGWSTLKFRHPAAQRWDTAGPLLQHRKYLLILKDLESVTGQHLLAPMGLQMDLNIGKRGTYPASATLVPRRRPRSP